MPALVDHLAVPLEQARARVSTLPWYHTIDVAPGLTTPGWWDLRDVLPLLPFPEVRGRRCLDVGCWDGFYAYEMWRRGADEVVAVDLPDLAGLDYPPDVRADPQFDPGLRGHPERSAGFMLVRELTGAPVEWRGCSVYDLDPRELGTFDVVVCGSLLVHLRDPVAALDAIRRVTSGRFLSIDYVHVPLNLLSRRRPLFQLAGRGDNFQWWLASDAGYRHLLDIGGFEVVEASKRFLLTFGESPLSTARQRAARRNQMLNWLFARDRRQGHPHVALLCRPRF